MTRKNKSKQHKKNKNKNNNTKKYEVTEITEIKVATFSASAALQGENVDVPVVPPDIEEKQDVEVEIPPSDDKEMIKALRKEIEKLNKEIKVLQNEKVEDQQKILELQQEIIELKKQIKRLEENNERLEKSNERLEKNNERLEEQIINLQKDFKDFKISQLILSEYRDWIHGFMMVLVKKFSDLKSFEDLKNILRSERLKDKRNKDGLPFVNDEMLKRISQLKSDLGKYKLTFPECRRLLELKRNSNMTFHGNRNDNLVKVIQDFKKIQFPNDLLEYQTPLNKMFEALEILEGSVGMSEEFVCKEKDDLRLFSLEISYLVASVAHSGKG
ncbi:hypothetical protein RhiirA5_476180 [Rhizophagus irregularis]|uniref:Uncharacterized protein n=1 Tax=Rhizophagus irregularis TaxID=588596 RepID=A0A2N0RZI9_9GLOM|nr:hypothetical protein RhiirA5_476180 [Rhizophagus irregularis]PKC68718.1 hypothetical protein RhiirA1_506395 [Rhizophagus irregularis]